MPIDDEEKLGVTFQAEKDTEALSDKVVGKKKEGTVFDGKEQEKKRKGLGKLMEKAKVDKAFEEARKKEPDKFKKFLKQKDRLLKILKGEEKAKNEEEKRGVLALLLELLKYIWQELKQFLSEEDGEFSDVVKMAKEAGHNTPKEMFLFLLEAFDFNDEEKEKLSEAIVEEDKRLEQEKLEKTREGLAKEKTGDLTPEKLREMLEGEDKSEKEINARLAAAKHGGRGGAGFGGLNNSFTQSLSEGIRDYYVSLNEEANLLIDQELKAQNKGDVPEKDRLNVLIEKKNNQITSLVRKDQATALPTGRSEIDNIAHQLGLYSDKAPDLYRNIASHEKAGIFSLLAADAEELLGISITLSSDKKSFTVQGLEKGKVSPEVIKKGDEPKFIGDKRFEILIGLNEDEVDKDKKVIRDGVVGELKKLKSVLRSNSIKDDVKEARLESFKERIRQAYIKPLFEEIVGDAESDPREGFQMANWGQSLFATLTDRLDEAGRLGSREKRGYEQYMYARKVTSFINSEMIRGGDPQEIHKVAGRLLLSEDLDTLAAMEPNLTPAMSAVERELVMVRMIPKNEGRIPYKFLIPYAGGGYKPAEIEVNVAKRLMRLHEKGVLSLIERGSEEAVKREAERVAALGVRVMNVNYRAPEHVGMTQLNSYLSGGHLVSYPYDKVPLRSLRLGPERFESYGRGREGSKPWLDRLNKNVQGGVWEKIPGNALDKWEINTENYLHFGGPLSGSSWRSLQATVVQRSRGVALGVELYSIEERAKKLIRGGDEREKEKIKKELAIPIWEKVGERLPTVVARYFPTLALEELEPNAIESDYFNLEKRIRENIVSKGNDRKTFNKIVDKKVEKRYKDGGYGGLIVSDVDKDADSKLVKDKALEIKRRVAQREKELKLQLGAETAFTWMLAKEFGDIPQDEKDWEKWEKDVFEKWESLHERLSIYEDKALKDYLKDEEGYLKDCKGDKNCIDRRDKSYKSVKELVDADELSLGFTVKEKKVLDRLTDLGVEGKSEKGAERMAGVKFSFLPFMEDFVQEEAEWHKLGPRGVSRRLGGDAEYAFKTDQVMNQIDNGLHGPEDRIVQHRKELAKSLTELYVNSQHMNEEQRQDLIAAKADTIMSHMYKADGWTKLPIIGPLADWGGPWGSWKPWTLSSNAQRKFGKQALSLTTLERYQFINDLRPMIGNDRAGKLMKMNKCRLGHVVAELAIQYGPVAIPVGIWALALKPFLDELSAYLKEDLMR